MDIACDGGRSHTGKDLTEQWEVKVDSIDLTTLLKFDCEESRQMELYLKGICDQRRIFDCFLKGNNTRA